MIEKDTIRRDEYTKKRGTIKFLCVGVYGFEPQTLCL